MAGVMRAAVFPGDSVAKVVEIQRPEPGPTDVLIRLTQSGVCGTDVHYWHQTPEERGPRDKIVPGHEAVGVVESTGEGVQHPSPGERVVVGALHIGCGRCRPCCSGNHVYCARKEILGRTLHGSYGEYVCVPDRAVYRLPDGVSDPAAVVAACNLATAYSALRKAGIGHRTRLAVFGLGGVGQSGVLVGARSGAEVVAVDPVRARRDAALRLGATAAYDPEETTRAVGSGDLTVDVALETSGHPLAQATSLDVLAPGGRVIVVGLGGGFAFPPGQITGREITISGSAVCRPDEFHDVLDFARQAHDELVSMTGPTFRIDQVEDALHHASSREDGKALFEW